MIQTATPALSFSPIQLCLNRRSPGTRYFRYPFKRIGVTTNTPFPDLPPVGLTRIDPSFERWAWIDLNPEELLRDHSGGAGRIGRQPPSYRRVSCTFKPTPIPVICSSANSGRKYHPPKTRLVVVQQMADALCASAMSGIWSYVNKQWKRVAF